MMSLQLQNLAETYGGRLLVLCAVLLMTAQIFVCLQAQRQHRSRLSICFHALHALIGFSLTTCLLDGIYRLPDPDTPYARIAPVVHLLFSLPWTVIMAAELISAMFLVISYRDNRYYAKTMRNALRDLRMVTDKATAQQQLPKVESIIDRLAKKGIIHKNKAANLKSGLMKKINNL